MQEFEKFEAIRSKFCKRNEEVTPGKMMSSPAIHYQGKVFAFFSRKKKIVFKLGEPAKGKHGPALEAFSPFKSKKALRGWYESEYRDHRHWESLASEALKKLKKV